MDLPDTVFTFHVGLWPVWRQHHPGHGRELPTAHGCKRHRQTDMMHKETDPAGQLGVWAMKPDSPYVCGRIKFRPATCLLQLKAGEGGIRTLYWGFCNPGIQPAEKQVFEKIPESFRNQTLNLPLTNNCSHSIYIAFRTFLYHLHCVCNCLCSIYFVL